MEDNVYDLGLYVGEVIRRNTKGVRWVSQKMDAGDYFVLEDAHSRMSAPLIIAYHRIYKIDYISLGQYAYEVIRKVFISKNADLETFDSEDLRIHHHPNSDVALISKKIISGEAEFHQLHMLEGIYYLTSKNERIGKNLYEGFDLYFMDEARKMFPEMKYFREIDENYVMRRQNDGAFRRELISNLTYFKSATSAIQMRLKFSPLTWIKYNTFSGLSRIFSCLIFLYLANWVSAWWWIAALYMCYENYHYWVRLWITFRYGHINPGVVMSTDPDVVVVYHDLAKKLGSFPSMTVSHHNLQKEDKQRGKIIPMVIYFGNNDRKMPFNTMVYPYPVRFGIKDQSIADALSDSFSEKDLEILEDTISLNKFENKGLFKLYEDSSDWIDFPDFVDNNTWYLKNINES